MLCDFWARIALIESSERVHSVWGEMGTQASLNHHNDNGFIFVSLLSFTKQKSNAFIQSKQKNDVPHLQASASVSAHFPASINKSNQHTADSDRHPMDVRNLVWPVRLRHWVQLTSNQSINQSIRVVTRKSVRNVNDKIMEYKSSCCGTESVKKHW